MTDRSHSAGSSGFDDAALDRAHTVGLGILGGSLAPGWALAIRRHYLPAVAAVLASAPPAPSTGERESDRSKNSKILAGLQDALAFAQGDESRGRIVHPVPVPGGAGDLADPNPERDVGPKGRGGGGAP